MSKEDEASDDEVLLTESAPITHTTPVKKQKVSKPLPIFAPSPKPSESSIPAPESDDGMSQSSNLSRTNRVFSLDNDSSLERLDEEDEADVKELNKIFKRLQELHQEIRELTERQVVLVKGVYDMIMEYL